MSNEQSEQKNIVTGKRLPCGGIAVYGIDIKTKQKIQIGYIGKNLAEASYWTQDIKLEK